MSQPAEDRPLVVVAAGIIVREGKVLLTKRLDGAHLGGMWEFPGGKLRRGERPEVAVVRECLEETNVNVRVRNIFDVVFHAYELRDVLLLFYRCDWVSGEVEHREVADHAWVTADELNHYEFPPADAGIVAQISAIL